MTLRSVVVLVVTAFFWSRNTGRSLPGAVVPADAGCRPPVRQERSVSLARDRQRRAHPASRRTRRDQPEGEQSLSITPAVRKAICRSPRSASWTKRSARASASRPASMRLIFGRTRRADEAPPRSRGSSDARTGRDVSGGAASR
jgi:hypothetical protein